MQTQARIVIIGGGITGCSVLFHLVKAGVKDAVLVEKGELTSGATCQAAGMLTQSEHHAHACNTVRVSTKASTLSVRWGV